MMQDAGVSFNVTPPKGGAFTPNKMLLMNRERRMNMLSPLHGEKLFNADIETGKVINEWGFQKDGVDVAMKVYYHLNKWQNIALQLSQN